ncbi:MAG: Xaa-Pro dipeptidyl-peptidase [Planctomycetes bacterium]|nr:Xaa-Pro dipeptidyl-peptidase [Planctomycetota bacterium]MCB9886539.1 Xaa-Pro dipeptidyl-peptidase [Planctomycetota bacterium]
MAKLVPGVTFPALTSLLTLAAVAVAQDADKATPRFVDGQAQVVDAFRNPQSWIRHHLWVEASFDSDGDGKKDRLHVDVWRPQQTDTEGLKVPVVYETSPYFAGVGGNEPGSFWDPHQELGSAPKPRTMMKPIAFQADRNMISPSEVRTWVPRGFAVVHSESPGTGLSEGCPTVGGANEALAPKCVIDWLCGRAKGFTTIDGNEEVKADWCTGKVGMIGTSYNGTLPIAAATTGVQGLEAIVPIAPNTSYYLYYRSNGLVRHPGGYMGEDVDVLYDFINSGDPKTREWCNKHVRDEEIAPNLHRDTGDLSDWWIARDYGNQLANYKAATLMAHGFNDWNVMPEHTVRIYAALKQKGLPCMAYFHQGGHGGPPPLELVNRWFTRFLYGIDNGVEKDPKAWIVREGDRKPTPYADYPNPDASPVVLRPGKGGGGVGALTVTDNGEDVQETLVDDAEVAGADLAKAETSNHRLLYATAELKEAVHISGTGHVSIRMTASKSAANLSVWIVSLPWTDKARIYENLITRGWADPQNAASLTESKPIVPGEFVTVKFALQPDDHVVPAGQRIGLMIFSSDKDFTLWPPAGTELTVDLGATTLDLPIVGGAEAFAKALGK